MSKTMDQKKTESNGTETQPSHISKVKPRPSLTVLGPGNGCRPSGTT